MKYYSVKSSDWYLLLGVIGGLFLCLIAATTALDNHARTINDLKGKLISAEGRIVGYQMVLRANNIKEHKQGE